MTYAGIQLVKAVSGNLAESLTTLAKLSGDAMLSSVIVGWAQSIPEICDLAIAGLRKGVALSTLAELAIWLKENPDEAFVVVPRNLADLVVQSAETRIH